MHFASRQHTHKKIIEEYTSLKVRFFRFLDSSSQSKGHIRAYVGAKTWLYEQNALSKGEDNYKAHVGSFGKALDNLDSVIASGEFTKSLHSAIEAWHAEGEPLHRSGDYPPLLPPPIPHMNEWQTNGLSFVSLFSGAFGLDLGFIAAGFDLRFATDIDDYSAKVASRNLPAVSFLPKDFDNVSCEQILDLAHLGSGEVDVLVGGPPCQPFSTAGKREGLNDPRSSPLKGFVRAIKGLKPRAFVMEEVTGLKSSRLKHVPIAERGERPLAPEEKKGSTFEVVLEMLRSTGYKFVYGTLNAGEYGAPQSRRRVIFIGLRDGKPSLPRPTHTRDQPNLFAKPLLQSTFWEATADLCGHEHHFTDLSETREKYMRLVPPGGHWRHLPESLVKDAMGGAYNSGGGKMGFFRRLPWDDVSPTVVTSPTQKGSMLCHPEANRPLSVEEYGRIQGFPDDWDLPGSTATKYKLIGNAVPVHLSYAIANHLQQYLEGSTE